MRAFDPPGTAILPDPPRQPLPIRTSRLLRPGPYPNLPPAPPRPLSEPLVCFAMHHLGEGRYAVLDVREELAAELEVRDCEGVGGRPILPAYLEQLGHRHAAAAVLLTLPDEREGGVS